MHKDHSSLGHIEGGIMCADIHTKGFGSSRTSGLGSRPKANQRINFKYESELIGEPGRGWLNWTEHPGNYIRKQSQRDPWATDDAALPAAEPVAPPPMGLLPPLLSPTRPVRLPAHPLDASVR